MAGAYALSLMSLAGLPYPLCFVTSFVLAGLSGVLVSIPALKLKAMYLAIMLLLFAEAFRLIFKNEVWIAGGPLGLRGIPSGF
jgi:branched-chain amino acid transport system permease protein